MRTKIQIHEDKDTDTRGQRYRYTRTKIQIHWNKHTDTLGQRYRYTGTKIQVHWDKDTDTLGQRYRYTWTKIQIHEDKDTDTRGQRDSSASLVRSSEEAQPDAQCVYQPFISHTAVHSLPVSEPTYSTKHDHW